MVGLKMEMPKSCAECKYCIGKITVRCAITEEKLITPFNCFKEISKNCPLKPIECECEELKYRIYCALCGYRKVFEGINPKYYASPLCFDCYIEELQDKLAIAERALEYACEKVDFIEETCVYRDKKSQELSQIIYGNSTGESKYTPNSKISFPNGFGKQKQDFCMIAGCTECYKHYFIEQATAELEREKGEGNERR